MALLTVPVYLFDTDALRILWANEPALAFWSASSCDELCSRDFSIGMTQTVKSQLNQIRTDCHDRKVTVDECWTLYPLGRPKTANFFLSAFETTSDRKALLIEIQEEAENADVDRLYRTMALMHTDTMISAYDEHFRLVYSNPAARNSTLPGCACLEDILRNESDSHIILNGLSERDHFDVELEVNTCHGPQWHSMHLQRCTNPTNARQMFLVSSSDTTDRRNAQQAVFRLAYTDSLTSLPNRAALNRFLEELVSTKNKNDETRFGLFFLDLDRFKNINDSLGHAAGDQLLIDVSQRLKLSVGVQGQVYRFGGDEFVMVITLSTRYEELKTLAENVLYVMAEPVKVAGHKLRILPSIGICRYPQDGQSISGLLENADAAMYIAKAHQSGYCFYDRKMSTSISESVKERMGLENDLVTALKNDEFELYFQPRVSCLNMKVVGVEALIRWHHPSRGMVPPDKFIGIAEETGQIIDLGNWVLMAAMNQQRQWQELGIQIPVSVNISARQFSANDLLANVSDALKKTGCDPQMIELEITESMLVGEPDAVHATLQQLSAMGLGLALDDFGTGYSNLAYLQKYPLDCLKIDKVFLADRKRSMLLGTILNMGKVLGLSIVAEGVETAAQADWLIARSCDQMQGFYFSKPLPVDDATQYLESNGAPRVSAPSIHHDRKDKAA